MLVVFAASLLASAFLLFAIQPLFAKLSLPILGGSSSVWSVAMVFFQAMLLAGYAYAHLVTVRLPQRAALGVHAAVLALGALWLPIGLSEALGAPSPDMPAAWLFLLFTISVGPPFFALSANAPLLQAWFSRSGHPDADDPYFLYGASNLGSFSSLLLYPALIEPHLRLGEQTLYWSWGYAATLIAILAAGYLASGPSQTGLRGPRIPARSRTIQPADKAWWIGLSFVPTGLLVAVTAHITTDIASAPFLWVIPLALFLLTFVLTFRARPLMTSATAARLFAAAACFWGMAELRMFEPQFWVHFGIDSWFGGLAAEFGRAIFPFRSGIWVLLAANLAVFFLAAFNCHSELVRRRPAAESLTTFYLLMSLGGVLGGIFASLVAPNLFSAVVEYPMLLAASALALPPVRKAYRHFSPVGKAGVVLIILVCSAAPLLSQNNRAIAAYRNFFGVKEITERNGARLLSHGSTVHGGQVITPGLVPVSNGHPQHIAYYSPLSPMGEAIRRLRPAQGLFGNRVGIVGLGTGSLACHGLKGESWVLFEIDPQIVDIARDTRRFSFMNNCAGDARVVLGDARLTLADEPDRSYDILVIDAFSSDSIPTHLITEEAIGLYMRKLAPGGALILHISNRYLSLSGVVAAAAQDMGLPGRHAISLPGTYDVSRFVFPSEVAVLAREKTTLAPLRDAPWEPLAADARIRPWTDDYSDVLSALIRGR